MAQLLGRYGVEVLADTRSIPRSRRNPQFNPEALAPFLSERGIEYQHHGLLGGRRHARRDSPNTAWQNEAFRGYADYMQTPPFAEGMGDLEELAVRRTVAIMCAELVWWRCHRRMLADRLTVDGFQVLHLMGPAAPPALHRSSPGLTVRDGVISYPGPQPPLL